MVTVGGILLRDLDELRTTWTRAGDRYTSPDRKAVLCLAGPVEIGQDVEIGTFVEIGHHVKIGPRVEISPCVEIGSRVRIGPFVKISPRVKIGDFVKIDSYAKIGPGVEIFPGAKIGSYTLAISPLWFPRVSSTTYPIGVYSPGMVTSGCITKSIKWWEENIRRCAEEHHYTPAEIYEYEWRIKVIGEWMKRWGVYEENKKNGRA